MTTVKCTYENGDTVTTRINATFEEAQDYFLNRVFNIGDGPDDNMQKCIAVKEIVTVKGLTPKQQEIIRQPGELEAARDKAREIIQSLYAEDNTISE